MQGYLTSHQEISLLLYQYPQHLPSFLPSGDTARHLTYTHLNSPVNPAVVWRPARLVSRLHDQRLADGCPARQGNEYTTRYATHVIHRPQSKRSVQGDDTGRLRDMSSPQTVVAVTVAHLEYPGNTHACLGQSQLNGQICGVE